MTGPIRQKSGTGWVVVHRRECPNPSCDEGTVDACASHSNPNCDCPGVLSVCDDCAGNGYVDEPDCDCPRCGDEREHISEEEAEARVMRRLLPELQQVRRTLEIAQELADADRKAFGYPGALGTMRGGVKVAREQLDKVLAKFTEAA